MQDRLWAPWRSGYINMKKKPRCIFCVGKSSRLDAKRYILKRGAHFFSILNAFPYNNGHVMIAPYRHVKDLRELSGEELGEMMALLIETKARLNEAFKPHGYNIGLNIGRAGGAGFDRHIHMHIVPRWSGDTNFMPVVARTKVVSDSLDAVYSLLTKKSHA